MCIRDRLTNAGVEALTSCAHLDLEKLSFTSDYLDSDAVALITRSDWSPVSIQLALGGMDDHAFDVLAQWPGLARLRELDLRGSTVSPGALAALLDSPLLGTLTTLRLVEFSADPDDILELLASRPSLSALQRLSVSCSTRTVTSRGYAAAAASPYLSNLRWFDADLDSSTNSGRAILVDSPHLSGALRAQAKVTPDE